MAAVLAPAPQTMPAPAGAPEAELPQLTAEQIEEMEAEATEMEARRIASLDAIGETLERDKETAVRWRADFEAQWMLDYEQYNSAASPVGDSKAPGRAGSDSAEDEYRKTRDNITRPKVIITAARLGDMLFPTNDSNFSIEASPKPDVPQQLLGDPPAGPPDPQTGQPTPGQWTPTALALAAKDYARKAAGAMNTTIRDQLEECQYSEAGRTAIFDSCLYGTGVIRGPRVKSRKRWGWQGQQAETARGAVPSAEHVDLWSFFPQPSRSMEECEHVFQLHLLPSRAVRKLAHQPGFDRSQISRLLGTTPEHGALANTVLAHGALRPDTTAVLTNRFSVWEYHGPMPKEAFAAFADGLFAQGLITDEDSRELAQILADDPMTEIDCEVWFSQGIVIKMALSTLAPGEIGYHVFNYEDNPNSIFGYGVPYLCRDDQLATNQVWHAMMLNGMMSAGPQIGVRMGSLEAMPGGRAASLSATKPRVWALNDDVADIRQALSVFIVPNVTQALMGLYERSKANADEHTMTPLIAQGEATQAVPTSSGMAMLMNAANVVMRRLAKAWDDRITVPLIGQFYDWNMANNPDPAIKGDHCVIPKGASHLLIKDVQAQHVQFATTLFSNNPQLAPYMKGGQFARKNIEMLDLSVEEMLYTDDEVAQQQQAQGEQPDPDTIKAQAQQAIAQAKLKQAEAEERETQARLELDAEQMRLNHEFRMADIAARREIQAMQNESQMLGIQSRMAQMERDDRLEMQRLMVEMRNNDGKLNLGQYQADVKARVDAERVAQADEKLATQLQVEAPNVKIQ